MQANENVNDNVNDNIISPPYNPPPYKVGDRERKLTEFDLDMFSDTTLDMIDDITRKYPRKGFNQTNAQCAILNAVQREIDKGSSEEQACDIIQLGVSNYLQAVKQWKATEKKYITDIVKFFRNNMFLEDPAIWVRDSKSGATDYDIYIPKN